MNSPCNWRSVARVANDSSALTTDNVMAPSNVERRNSEKQPILVATTSIDSVTVDATVVASAVMGAEFITAIDAAAAANDARHVALDVELKFGGGTPKPWPSVQKYEWSTGGPNMLPTDGISHLSVSQLAVAVAVAQAVVGARRRHLTR